METTLLVSANALLAGVILLLLLLWRVRSRDAADRAAFLAHFAARDSSADRALREEMRDVRGELAGELRGLRGEVTDALRGSTETLVVQLGVAATASRDQLEAMRGAVSDGLTRISDDNARKLEEMRATVDEKLNATLQTRLGQSFDRVSKELARVYEGLGEMKTLAHGVGDLKKVLSNVKTRGTWGEISLGQLLEQVLTPRQYAKNVATRPGCAERVEFAVRLPGDEAPVWLPIDAKFPQEDYQRLIDAAERADAPGVELAGKALEARVKACAKDIATKYVEPPHTTDFAILFVPVEGLFAEIVRRPGLLDSLQRDHRVMVAGPTTLSTLLNGLQMGFRTLAIQERSSEVWELLGKVRGEYAVFAGILEKVQKKLSEASSSVEDAAKRTRAIEKKLKRVETAPSVTSSAGPSAPGLPLLAPAPEEAEECEDDEEPGTAARA